MGLGRLYETHSGGGGGGYNHTILVNQLLQWDSGGCMRHTRGGGGGYNHNILVNQLL